VIERAASSALYPQFLKRFSKFDAALPCPICGSEFWIALQIVGCGHVGLEGGGGGIHLSFFFVGGIIFFVGGIILDGGLVGQIGSGGGT